MKRLVRDVMSTGVVCVTGATPFKEVVETLQTEEISAVPVTDMTGDVIGIISEADLLLKEEQRGQQQPFIEGPRRWRERLKAEAAVAREVMSSPAVTVQPTATIGEAARLMHRKGVKRLPVVDGHNRPIGIVSRSDLLRVFLRPDEEIRAEIQDRIVGRLLDLDPLSVHVAVRNGEVVLAGQLERRSMLPLAEALVQGVDGVIRVECRLGWQINDEVVGVPHLPWTAP